MSNDLSIKEYETINDLLLVSFTDSTDAVIPIKKLREMCPCASCAGETDALGNVYKDTPKELKDNSFIYGGWKPKAPIHFMHGEKDKTVFHFLMKLGADQLISNGSKGIKTTSYPGDHGGAAPDCMINSIKWFNTMKQ